MREKGECKDAPRCAGAPSRISVWCSPRTTQVHAWRRRGVRSGPFCPPLPASDVTMPVGLQGYIYRRHIQSQVFGALARLLLPLTQRDLQAGLKGLSARAAGLVLPHLRCDGFGFDCELLTACVRFGLAIT